MKTFFISFCGDSGNLGVCIVDAMTEEDAITKTHYLGINPGGEAMIFPIDKDDKMAQIELAVLAKNTLIPPSMMEALGYHNLENDPPELMDKLRTEFGVTVMCEDCNKNRCTKHGKN